MMVWKPEWLLQLEMNQRGMRFLNYSEEQRERRKKLFLAANEFAERYEQHMMMKGIYIFGPTGVGKTHLLNAIANRLEERGIMAVVINVGRLIDWLSAASAQHSEMEKIIQTLVSVPVLLLDEIGQEFANEWTIKKIYQLINLRYTARLPVLYASNQAPPDLYKRLSGVCPEVVEPLVSRIAGTCRIGFLDGEDYRVEHSEFIDEDESNDNDTDLENNEKDELKNIIH